MKKTPYYITTPIYYPSANLHIGNAYTTVAADALARYARLQGKEVLFLTGTDEHGQKIQRIAQEKGVTPKAYVDEIVAGIKDLWQLLNISYDRFIRTTDDYHKESVQKIFKRLYDQGDIYKSEYEGWYCTPCEAFWTESQAGPEHTCPDCGRPLERAKEESYFFRMSKYADRLIEYIEAHPDFIQPESRKNEMLNNFLKPGLQDLAVSRTSFDWGIKVPFDERHVIYVWIDALSNYLSALGYENEAYSDFKTFWPADLHLVGKDIIRFHTIYWPIMLMALDLPLPEHIYGHGWLMFNNEKMSKSKGNIVDPVVLAEHFGVDPIRYFLLREIPFGSDGNFNNEAFIRKINTDLANDLGNLLSRSVTMVEKYFDSVIPEPKVPGTFDEELESILREAPQKVDEAMEHLKIPEALAQIWNIIDRANKYIDETMPWALAKDPEQKDRLGTVLNHLLESLRYVATLLQPFLPETAQKLFDQLGIAPCGFDSLNTLRGMTPGDRVRKGAVIYPRIDLEKKLSELEALAVQDEGAQKPTAKLAPLKPEISIEDFEKIDFRVAKVLACEPMKGAKKLLLLTVDLGNEQRQVVSGIAAHYRPEELVGRSVVLVANLKPAKLRGTLSEGMVLAASDEGDEHLFLVGPQGELPPGSCVR
ncbi:Methionyl-tRNA synthetase [Clostridiaceae bacterium JG1575]|nr:Methionyl-tRNA synthetase [Clostridiaceae bacterium JG1575]